jgi:hypothetical protein
MDGHPDTESPLLVDVCRRRADAILDMQPWRQVVVISMYSRSDVRFRQVSHLRGAGVRHTALSRPQQLFILSSNDELDMVGFGEGFHLLLFFLLYPEQFGYLSCPVTVRGLQGHC